MNGAHLIKSGITRIGVWCALAGATILLTVLFNFLGNLTVAVGTGVVLGSARRWRWSAIPVSLVFPAVILGLSHYFKSELPPGKIQLIALVCGAAFWVVYALSFGLHVLEQKEEVPAARAKERGGLPGDTFGVANGTDREFSLTELHGCWVCTGTATDGSPQHRTLRIEGGKFALTEGGPGDRRQEMAQGEVRVEQSVAGEPVVTLTRQPHDQAVNRTVPESQTKARPATPGSGVPTNFGIRA
jgi:hypothetical protein